MNRRSFAGRVSMSVASRLSVAGSSPEMRSGTVFGATINTLCSVMGAGVLTLPVALYNTSIVPGLAMLTFVMLIGAFAVYCLVCGCDRTGRYSMTEVVAFALFPPQSFDEYQSEQQQRRQAHQLPLPASGAVTTAATAETTGNTAAGHTAQPQEDLHTSYLLEELRRRQWRRILTLLTELIIFCSNFGFLIVYGKVIMESMPPVVKALTRDRGGFLEDEMFWLVSSGVVFFFFSCSRNMEELKWTSLLGFLTIFYIVVCVVFRYHTSTTHNYPHVNPGERQTIRVCELHTSVFRGLTTFGMAVSYHYNVPYFYKELRRREPREMMCSVLWAFPIIGVCYACTGVFGYLTFGKQVTDKRYGGNIVLHYANRDLLVNIGRFGLFFHFVCVFPIVAICTRRALHRILMTCLLFPEQSRQMREAAGLVASSDEDDAAVHAAVDVDAAETTPLLQNAVEGSAEATATSGHTPTTTGTARPAAEQPTTSPSGADRMARAALGWTAAETEELDRDVGSVEDTTQLALVLETLVLVVSSVVLAAAVSGIDVVIDVVGMLFSVFLVFIGPAMVGIAIFTGRPALRTSSSFHRLSFSGLGSPFQGRGAEVDGAIEIARSYRHVRVKVAICVLSIVTGVFITGIGLALMLIDAGRKARERNRPRVVG